MNQTTRLVLIAFAVGIGGVLTGTLVRRLITPAPITIESSVPRHRLARGSAFPDVAVVDDTGHVRQTASMLAEGGVALFLDLECEPCDDMSLKWQQALDGGAIDGLRVVGITMHDQYAIQDFRMRNKIRFPIVADTARVFLGEYNVARFPLEVIVDSEGRIRRFDHDWTTPLDADEIAALLSR